MTSAGSTWTHPDVSTFNSECRIGIYTFRQVWREQLQATFYVRHRLGAHIVGTSSVSLSDVSEDAHERKLDVPWKQWALMAKVITWYMSRMTCKYGSYSWRESAKSRVWVWYKNSQTVELTLYASSATTQASTCMECCITEIRTLAVELGGNYLLSWLASRGHTDDVRTGSSDELQHRQR